MMARSNFFYKIDAFPRLVKEIVLQFLDVILCFLTAWLAFCVRYDQFLAVAPPMLLVGGLSAIIAIPVFKYFGFYKIILRYAGWFVIRSLIKPVVVYGSICVVVFMLIGVNGVPKSIGFIQPTLLLIFVGSTRLFSKYLLSQLVSKDSVKHNSVVALIYGAGSAGRQIASGLRQSVEIMPFAFVDDDPRRWNLSINGLPVYAPKQIPKLLDAGLGISDVFLAMPSVGRTRIKEILSELSELPVQVRILPGLSALANGVVKIEDTRQVEIEDVLGREPVIANEAILRHNIYGNTILVTGAGGSIGSELCRQILEQRPVALVLFELSEFALYAIERELALPAASAGVKIYPILGSVLDFNKIKRVCQKYGVKAVYHAAAYKHVPMIEINPSAGVWNNVFGTLRAVDAACESGVETFVLVSTDKAVRPTNVMGCSKRLAELVLQAKSMEAAKLDTQGTKLTMVRFGNVLGSSGSVVPVFREQIRNGGPVTVTHPEIIRYFMTIPEAAQLVIQAGSIGEGGDVMVLDMGEPVKIVDLAKRMIHLSGYTHRDETNPYGDIEIKYTGLRPGEKLYEELLIGENTLPTPHIRIMRAIEHALGWEELQQLLFELEAAVHTENSKLIREILKRAVPEFNPQTEV